MNRDSRGARLAVFEERDSRFMGRKTRDSGGARLAVFALDESPQRSPANRGFPDTRIAVFALGESPERRRAARDLWGAWRAAGFLLNPSAVYCLPSTVR